MVFNALMLTVLVLLSFIGTVVCVIFMIISFANNKQGKYAWLAGFLIGLTAIICCIFIFVRKAANKVEHFTETLNERMKDNIQSYSDSVSAYVDPTLKSNEHIQLLKSYSLDSASIPDQFYYYLGFETYYRFPLKYPFSIHCNTFKDNGELFNETNVKRFDENDNGELSTSINHIDKIAFDKKFLLIDQKITSTRSADFIHHYILFSFETEKTEEANSEKELVKLAKQKGYNGATKLITIEEYDKLFYVYPASDVNEE